MSLLQNIALFQHLLEQTFSDPQSCSYTCNGKNLVLMLLPHHFPFMYYTKKYPLPGSHITFSNVYLGEERINKQTLNDDKIRFGCSFTTVPLKIQSIFFLCQFILSTEKLRLLFTIKCTFHIRRVINIIPSISPIFPCIMCTAS